MWVEQKINLNGSCLILGDATFHGKHSSTSVSGCGSRLRSDSHLGGSTLGDKALEGQGGQGPMGSLEPLRELTHTTGVTCRVCFKYRVHNFLFIYGPSLFLSLKKKKRAQRKCLRCCGLWCRMALSVQSGRSLKHWSSQGYFSHRETSKRLQGD